MLIRTHLAFIVMFLILFVPHVQNSTVLVLVALAATFLPDIDSAVSTLGHNKIFRFLQFFIKHRGFLHSFTFAILASVALAIFWPVASLGFFLGYGLHLFLDSFTIEGMVPFWPYSKRSSWSIRTGGVVETTIFLVAILADVLLVVLMLLDVL